MNRIRRHTLAALAALACTALSVLGTGALAQPAYPAKPVTLVNNFPPGGPADILARSVGAVLQETLKQPFVVDNKPGTDRKFNRMRPSMARVLGLETRSAKVG